MRAVQGSRVRRAQRQGPFTLNQGMGPRADFLWTPGGRLTLSSGTPVTTSDVTGAATLYYTEYVHSVVPLFDGERFVPHELPKANAAASGAAEVSISLSGIANATVYDIFARARGGTVQLVIGPAWSSATARAAAGALARVLGRYVLSADPRLLYLGTIYASGAGTTEDSAAKRFVWNMYNRIPRRMSVVDTTDSWTYAANAWRQANASTANQVAVVRGLDEDPVVAEVSEFIQANTSASGGAGIGISSTTVNSATVFGMKAQSLANAYPFSFARYNGYPGIGYYTIVWLDGDDSAVTITFYGDGGNTRYQAGLMAEMPA